MATIRQRGSNWEAQIRRKGWPNLSRNFSTKADARAWATVIESEIERAAQESLALLRTRGVTNMEQLRTNLDIVFQTRLKISPESPRSGVRTRSRITAFFGQAPDQLLRFGDESLEMCGIPEAFRVDLVDVLRAGWTGREPAVRGRDLEAADRGIVSRRSREPGDDRVAGEALFLHVLG